VSELLFYLFPSAVQEEGGKRAENAALNIPPAPISPKKEK